MTTTKIDRPVPRRARGKGSGTGTALRLLARRVHFLAGILVAPFLAVLCLTGLVYVFSPQIHDDLYHGDLHVNRASGTPHPVSDLVRAALVAHPEGTVSSVITPAGPDRTVRVVLSVPGPPGTPDRTVFLDPYTGFINGELATVADRLPANTWLRALHSNLQLGEPGRIYAELAASWLPPIVIGGLMLWLARTRRKRRAREVLLPATAGKSGWVRLRGVHGSVGLWLSVGLLVAAVTGLAMSQFAGGRADQRIDPVHLRAPALAAAPVAVPAGVDPIGIDDVIKMAADAGLRGELSVRPPAAPDRPYTVAEMSEGLPVQRDSIAINPYTAAITEHIGWRDYPLPAKLSLLAAEFHTGSLFGLANQIVLALIAAGTLVLIAVGYRMWWIHNPYRGRWASIPRGVWRQGPWPVLLLVTVVAAALGWVLPVFGMSLAVFLVVDIVVGGILRLRKPTSGIRRL